jgi:phosphatidylinositol glycan class B
MTLLDSLYYGKLAITPLNFFLTNMSSVSSFYGSSPWHYYISQGLPILCTTALPFVIHGIWTSVQSKKAVALQTMAQLVLWTIGIYSLAGHKEWRFIHPILPLLHIFAAKSLDDLTTVRPLSKQRENDRRTKKRGKDPSLVSKLLTRIDIPISLKYLVWLTATIPLSLYAVLFYGSAPISAMTYLRSLPRSTLRNSTIGVLMPCHSLPGQAYLHRPELAGGRLWALGCEPPLQ